MSSAAQWTRQQSGTKARLRGLAVVNAKVVWASGTQGTYVRTTDGGITWKSGTVPGAADLDFRDVHAADERKAFLLSIGEGEKSRIYQTADGGNTWALRFINHDPRGFLDAIAFWDADHGIAMGDPVDGRFTILTTGDGGVNWKKSPPETHAPGDEGRGSVRRQWHLSGRRRRSQRLVWNRRGGCLPRVSIHGPRSNLDRPRDADRGGQSFVGRILAGVSRPERRCRCRGRLQEPGASKPRRRDDRRTEAGPGRCRKATGRAAIVPPSLMCRAQPSRHWSLLVPPGRISRPTAARHGCRWEDWGFTRSASRARSMGAGESAKMG